MSRFNPYALLKMHRGSTNEQIKDRFRVLCMELHPDRPGGGDVETFMLVTRAYHDIKNEEKRAQLADLMAFTCLPCKDCDAKGYSKRAGKGGKVVTICSTCEGCGYGEPRTRK